MTLWIVNGLICRGMQGKTGWGRSVLNFSTQQGTGPSKPLLLGMSHSVPTFGALWWAELLFIIDGKLGYFSCLCASVEWAEILGDLLIVLFRIFPFLLRN